MPVMKYGYYGIGKMKQIYLQLCGLTEILIYTGIGLFFFAGTIWGPAVPNGISLINDPRLTMICVGIWAITIAWLLCSTMINAMPTIWLDDHGLTVSTFLFFRTHIAWHDLIDVSPIRWPNSAMLVRAIKITFFHRVIGWIYSKSFYPGFLITDGIDGHNDLILRIHSNMTRRKWRKPSNSTNK